MKWSFLISRVKKNLINHLLVSEQFDRAVDGGKFTNIFYLDFHEPLAKLSQQATKIQNIILQGKLRPPKYILK